MPDCTLPSTLFTVHNDTIVTADWHVLHRNIYWFVPEARSALAGVEEVTELTFPQFLAAEVRTYERILTLLEATIETAAIRRFFFLGDLIFGLATKKKAQQTLDLLATEFPQFSMIFQLLKRNAVECTMIVGNHDDFRLRDATVYAFYQTLFDAIVPYRQEENLLFTHFPLGYSLVRDQTAGTPDEKYFRMNKFFYRLDQKLLEELKHREIVNFHGHIHNSRFSSPLPHCYYHNVAIDWRVTQPYRGLDNVVNYARGSPTQ